VVYLNKPDWTSLDMFLQRAQGLSVPSIAKDFGMKKNSAPDRIRRGASMAMALLWPKYGMRDHFDRYLALTTQPERYSERVRRALSNFRVRRRPEMGDSLRLHFDHSLASRLAISRYKLQTVKDLVCFATRNDSKPTTIQTLGEKGVDMLESWLMKNALVLGLPKRPRPTLSLIHKPAELPLVMGSYIIKGPGMGRQLKSSRRRGRR
jgi:hypothetical protein